MLTYVTQFYNSISLCGAWRDYAWKPLAGHAVSQHRGHRWEWTYGQWVGFSRLLLWWFHMRNLLCFAWLNLIEISLSTCSINCNLSNSHPGMVSWGRGWVVSRQARLGNENSSFWSHWADKILIENNYWSKWDQPNALSFIAANKQFEWSARISPPLLAQFYFLPPSSTDSLLIQFGTIRSTTIKLNMCNKQLIFNWKYLFGNSFSMDRLTNQCIHIHIYIYVFTCIKSFFM